MKLAELVNQHYKEPVSYTHLLSEGMELHIALPDYCEMEDVYFTYSLSLIHI